MVLWTICYTQGTQNPKHHQNETRDEYYKLNLGNNNVNSIFQWLPHTSNYAVAQVLWGGTGAFMGGGESEERKASNERRKKGCGVAFLPDVRALISLSAS